MDHVKLTLSPFHWRPHLLHVCGVPQHLGCMRDVGDNSLTLAGWDGAGEKQQ